MKRAFFLFSVFTCILLFMVLTTAAAQEQPLQPAVQTTCPYVLRARIPFAWLRFEPSSNANFSLTMLPGYTVQSNDPPTLKWDGVQWWVYIWPNFSSAKGYYWVEFNSLEPRCQPPSPTPTSSAAPWAAGDRVRVRLTVPFVWFRDSPIPGNPAIHTVGPGAILEIAPGPPISDTYDQWWWLMRDTRDGFLGWVEQNSVEKFAGSSTPVPPTGWQPGDIVRVRLTVPFSWMRSAPSSNSSFSFTAQSGQQLIVRQGPQNDALQNWWQVASRNSSATGWVEENSLEWVQRGS